MAGTVLLIEDEPSVGELVRAYLDRDGYRVIWVRSGEEGLAELDRHPVRIVILDLGLPGIDGFEVCRAMRARSAARPGGARARRRRSQPRDPRRHDRR